MPITPPPVGYKITRTVPPILAVIEDPLDFTKPAVLELKDGVWVKYDPPVKKETKWERWAGYIGLAIFIIIVISVVIATQE